MWVGSKCWKRAKVTCQHPSNVDCKARLELSKIIFGWQETVHGNCFKVDSRCCIWIGWDDAILNSVTVKVVQRLSWWVSGLVSGTNSLVNIISYNLETLPLMTCFFTLSSVFWGRTSSLTWISSSSCEDSELSDTTDNKGDILGVDMELASDNSKSWLNRLCCSGFCKLRLRLELSSEVRLSSMSP